MKKKQLNHFGTKKHFFIFSSFCLILMVFFSQSDTQALSIQGKVTASRYSVQNASVTFVDNADTTIKYSAVTDASGIYRIDILTSIGFNPDGIPDRFELAQNYPNPFSALTAIPYSLYKLSDVQMTIYDLLGREVRKFDKGSQAAGSHNIFWDGSSSLGTRVANGIYFCMLQTEDDSRVRKMILSSGGTGLVSLSQTGSSQLSKVAAQSIQEGNYTIRIENTDNTLPIIIPEQFDNVSIKNDTTINFSVTYVATTTIDLDSLHQIIRGYGAASPWYLPVATDSEIESTFGTDDGQIGLSIYRITVEADCNLWAKWVSSTKKAQELGAIIIASPWYAPSNLREFRNGENRIKLDKYDEYAAHLNSFITYMENNGVSIYGLSVQNEPEMGDWTNWTPNEIFTFMKDYADAIKGTNVMVPEVSNFGRSYSDPILNDSAACANTDIICGHIYGGGLSKYPLAEEKGKEVWMTEYLFGENNSGNNMYWAIELAKNINDVMQADMNAYVWWTMIRYYGPIGDGTKASNPADPNESYPAKGEVTKKGYVMSQYTRFIRPGYYRVECNILPWSCNVYITAYKDSSSAKAVIVAVNNNSVPMDLAIRIQSGSMNQFTSYVTTDCKNCVQGDDINIIDNRFIFILEASSITTFVSK